MRTRAIIGSVFWFGLLAACSSAPAGDALPDDTPERYRKSLQRAWDKVDEGRNPGTACASVVGMATGNYRHAPDSRADSRRAFEICYVDVREHAIQVRLAAIDAGEAADDVCSRLLADTQIARAALAGFAKDVDLDAAQLDSHLAQRVDAAVRHACPEMADTVLSH